jgi:hypothetical protein
MFLAHAGSVVLLEEAPHPKRLPRSLPSVCVLEQRITALVCESTQPSWSEQSSSMLTPPHALGGPVTAKRI